jgi:hypothetical protein
MGGRGGLHGHHDQTVLLAGEHEQGEGLLCGELGQDLQKVHAGQGARVDWVPAEGRGADAWCAGADAQPIWGIAGTSATDSSVQSGTTKRPIE